MPLSRLIGKRIIGVTVEQYDPNDDEVRGVDRVTFQTDAGPIRFRTYGDCCSETWLWHTEALTPLVGHVVTGVQELEMPEWNAELHGPSRQRSDCLYGYEIQYAGGAVILEFRNSSNGYYGGSLEYEDGDPRADC